jgi:hypothetical protein
MVTITFGAAGAALYYGSGSTEMMRLPGGQLTRMK